MTAPTLLFMVASNSQGSTEFVDLSVSLARKSRNMREPAFVLGMRCYEALESLAWNVLYMGDP